MEKYFQKDVECASREEILDIQNKKLVEQVKHVWENVPYYRKKMEEKGVAPDDIQSIDDLYRVDISHGLRLKLRPHFGEEPPLCGERGSGCVCLNGAAARKVQVGDVCIIISYALMDFEEAKTFKPTVVFPKEGNTL